MVTHFSNMQSKKIKMETKELAASLANEVAPIDGDETLLFPDDLKKEVRDLMETMEDEGTKKHLLVYVEAKNKAHDTRAAPLEFEYDFASGSLTLKEPNARLESAILKYVTNENEFADAVDTYIDLMTRGRLHLDFAMGETEKSLKLDRISPKVLFDYAAECHPQLKGTVDQPLAAEDFELGDLVRVVRHALAKNYHSEELERRPKLPPVLANAIV